MTIKNYLLNNRPLPLVYESLSDEPTSFEFQYNWIKDNQSELQKKILLHGAILFRFGIRSLDEFLSICKIFKPNLQTYKGGNSPRTFIKQNAYTSTEYPSELEIIQHQELSYTHSPPETLFFYCEHPPHSGGETPITDCRTLLKELDESLKNKFKNKRIKYIQNLPEGLGFGRSWKQTFETDDKSVVEQILEESGATYHWNNDDSLHWTQIRDGITTHPLTKESIWFNQADQWHLSQFDQATQEAIVEVFGDPLCYPLHALWEDNTEFDIEDFQKIRTLFNKLNVKNPWEKGDVLILDNFLVSHGRMPFEGERKVYVAMG